MDFLNFVQQLIPVIGQPAADLLSAKLRELIGDGSPSWQKTVLALVADAIERHGVQGIDIALREIEAILDNKTPQIDWANLMVASDLVATLQKMEADEKSAVRDYLTKVGSVLGALFSSIIRGLIAG